MLHISQPRKTNILLVSVYSIYIGLSVINYPFSVIPLASSNYFWWLLHPSLGHLQCTELPSLPWYSQLLSFLPFTQWHNQQTSCGIVKWATCWYLGLLQCSLDPVNTESYILLLYRCNQVRWSLVTGGVWGPGPVTCKMQTAVPVCPWEVGITKK